MLKAALVPLAFCALAFLFTSFQYTNPRAGHLPQNLTAFEYYRLGVRLSNQGYKPDYEDLLAAKESLLKASTIDKNGIIGRLAGNYEKFELPGFIPSNMVLEVYDAATQNYEREEIGAEDKLRRIIKIAPQFDWAYTKLAEILIDKKEYAEAEQLLAKANELNANSVNYLVTLSKLKSAAGNKGAAIALLKEAIDEDPTNLHLYQGYIYEWVTDEQH